MTHVSTAYPVQLGFLPSSEAIPDLQHPGLFRAGERGSTPYGGKGIEVRTCSAIDGCDAERPDVGLFTSSFDTVDLSPLHDLQSVLARIRSAGEATDDDTADVRRALDGAELECSSGSRVKVLQLAGEGMIMRKAGPNRMSVVSARTKGANGHGPATSVHADQDVYGTPLAQLMDGRAPELFRHDSPDGKNLDASLMLLNLWIPLHQITQPLVLGDARSFDRRRHQLRYGLATDSFLDRDDDQVINDIWTFLYDPGQRWHFRSEMDHQSAYLFDTLGTPHGAGVLPDEDIAERCSLALVAAESAAERGDAAELNDILSDPALLEVPDRATPALRVAIGELQSLIADALTAPTAVSEPWIARSRSARERVVRMSLEMRLVATVRSC
jgi:hypothetical protein